MKSRKTRMFVALWLVVISGFSLMVASAATTIKVITTNPKNAIQRIPEVKIVSTNYSKTGTLTNVHHLLKIDTQDNSFVLWNETSKAWGLSASILWWNSNKIKSSNYSTIIGWESNTIEALTGNVILWWNHDEVKNTSSYAVIAWWTNSTISNGTDAVIVWGNSNNINGGFNGVVLWNNSSVTKSNSVSLWENSKNEGMSSFLWTDESHTSSLTGNYVFAVVAGSWMVVNKDTAHSFAQLTIWESLIIDNSSHNPVCWGGKGKWILKVVPNASNSNISCFCSCDWQWRSSLFGAWMCNSSCNVNIYPGCGNELTKICTTPNKYTYSWSCSNWAEVVEWTWAYLVEENWLVHRTCQTNNGAQAFCSHTITNTSGSCVHTWVYDCTPETFEHADRIESSFVGLTFSDDNNAKLYGSVEEAGSNKCAWVCRDGYQKKWNGCELLSPCAGGLKEHEGVGYDVPDLWHGTGTRVSKEINTATWIMTCTAWAYCYDSNVTISDHSCTSIGHCPAKTVQNYSFPAFNHGTYATGHTDWLPWLEGVRKCDGQWLCNNTNVTLTRTWLNCQYKCNPVNTGWYNITTALYDGVTITGSRTVTIDWWKRTCTRRVTCNQGVLVRWEETCVDAYDDCEPQTVGNYTTTDTKPHGWTGWLNRTVSWLSWSCGIIWSCSKGRITLEWTESCDFVCKWDRPSWDWVVFGNSHFTSATYTPTSWTQTSWELKPCLWKRVTYSCTWTVPNGAKLISWTDTGLSSNVTRTLYQNASAAAWKKCAYLCDTANRRFYYSTQNRCVNSEDLCGETANTCDIPGHSTNEWGDDSKYTWDCALEDWTVIDHCSKCKPGYTPQSGGCVWEGESYTLKFWNQEIIANGKVNAFLYLTLVDSNNNVAELPDELDLVASISVGWPDNFTLDNAKTYQSESVDSMPTYIDWRFTDVNFQEWGKELTVWNNTYTIEFSRYLCEGSFANAHIITGSDRGLTSNQSSTLYASESAAAWKKCAWVCNDWYEKNGNKCDPQVININVSCYVQQESMNDASLCGWPAWMRTTYSTNEPVPVAFNIHEDIKYYVALQEDKYPSCVYTQVLDRDNDFIINAWSTSATTRPYESAWDWGDVTAWDYRWWYINYYKFDGNYKLDIPSEWIYNMWLWTNQITINGRVYNIRKQPCTYWSNARHLCVWTVPTNAVFLTWSDQGLASDTTITLYASESEAAWKKCAYYCPTGYEKNGNKCDKINMNYACTWSAPIGAKLISWTDQGLSSNVTRTLYKNASAAAWKKCAYLCDVVNKRFYYWARNSCVLGESVCGETEYTCDIPAHSSNESWDVSKYTWDCVSDNEEMIEAWCLKCKTGYTLYNNACVKPQCWSANWTVRENIPSTNAEKCSIWSAPNVSSTSTWWNRTCSLNWLVENCSAYKYPQCGSASGATMSNMPSVSQRCSIWSASPVDDEWTYWSRWCYNWWITVPCRANKPMSTPDPITINISCSTTYDYPWSNSLWCYEGSWIGTTFTASRALPTTVFIGQNMYLYGRSAWYTDGCHYHHADSSVAKYVIEAWNTNSEIINFSASTIWWSPTYWFDAMFKHGISSFVDDAAVNEPWGEITSPITEKTVTVDGQEYIIKLLNDCVSPKCGSADGMILSSEPSVDQRCYVWSPSIVTTNTNSYTWTCSLWSATPASCSAQRPVSNNYTVEYWIDYTTLDRNFWVTLWVYREWGTTVVNPSPKSPFYLTLKYLWDWGSYKWQPMTLQFPNTQDRVAFTWTLRDWTAIQSYPNYLEFEFTNASGVWCTRSSSTPDLTVCKDGNNTFTLKNCKALSSTPDRCVSSNT